MLRNHPYPLAAGGEDKQSKADLEFPAKGKDFWVPNQVLGQERRRNSKLSHQFFKAGAGLKTNKDWKPQAYQAAVDYLGKSLSVNVTKEQVKNKVRQWKKHFSIINENKSHQSGFPWDEEKKMLVVIVDNMLAWKDYVQENGKANGYANRPRERWDDIVMLCRIDVMLCRIDRATGEAAESFEDADEAMTGEDENDVEYSIPLATPPTQPSTSSMIESHQKKWRKDPLVFIVDDITSSLKEYMNLKKKPSGQEIYEMVSKVLGLSQ
ncbi:hypothetical protein SLEP1_g24560 [Rubroshorea leprosula]|uniref:Myb/SANT-like domain-containing protein n=1 Tax=Rubroshorea leprosula TaxID=152421 RepID=A0AAV5JND0_9ROSI|nr:hypothetical protein SLEP1_g24560 [Rubroshorea leprosula]